MTNTTQGELVRAGELFPDLQDRVPALAPPATALHPTKARLLTMPTQQDHDDIAVTYQHSVFCQNSMPYRNPGDHVISWERTNGHVSLSISASKVFNGVEAVYVGLPYGPKPRLLLCHLNTQALRTQSPVIPLDSTLTSFVRRICGQNDGRTIIAMRQQLARLAAAHFHFGFKNGAHVDNMYGVVLKGLRLWGQSDPDRRLLWPSVVTFSDDYFHSLMAHAIPLDDAAISRLSHNALALDIYSWMAQRLHRVTPSKPALVPWVSLKLQFGENFTRIRDFRRVFLQTLRQVCAVYSEARIQATEGGLELRQSPPPVPKRYFGMGCEAMGRLAHTVGHPVEEATTAR